MSYISQNLRVHAAALEKTGELKKAAALNETADLYDKFGYEDARKELEMRIVALAGFRWGNWASDSEAAALSFAMVRLGWQQNNQSLNRDTENSPI